MSRCVLDNREHEVVIGWDPGICSFFVQVLHLGADEPFIWKGNGGSTFNTPDPLIDIAEQYGSPFDRNVLRQELLKDQAGQLERNYSVHGTEVW